MVNIAVVIDPKVEHQAHFIPMGSTKLDLH
jgi:hypothetical protein